MKNSRTVWSRRRRFSAACVVTSLVVSLGSDPAFAATSRKALSASPQDRLRPDISKLPITTLVRRAAKARGTSHVAGTMSFHSDTKKTGEYTLNGAIDFDRSQGDIALTIEDSKKHYLVVDDTAYIEVDAELSATVDGKWISAPLTQAPRPEGVAVLDITMSSANLVAQATSWKETTSAVDKAAGSRRLAGTGSKSAFATIDVDRFLDKVPVEVGVAKDGSIASVKWQLLPKPESTDAEEIRLSITHTSTKPLDVIAPTDAVVSYSSIRNSA